MGCGGSRTDALEPRYPESWTKETESTWLTSTDTDVALSSIQKIPSENFSESGFASEKNLSSDFFDDGLPAPAQAYVTVCSAISESGLNERKEGNNGAELLSQDQAVTPSPGTTFQNKSVLRTEELNKRQDKQMSTKQVTITVTQRVRQVDKRGAAVEKSRTTIDVMKPAEGTKEDGKMENKRLN
ncbi:brain and acute leukemia cytoplasmic protein-like [Scleropages formosus]|uniref:Brain and acute leukemia cytoplasmic protein-like n=1 Tax=Scleropages formosus TaxID=113540 RepID=A0A0N8JWN6_SCLFO|nr:brain and acute leukemia cytoplasmic protein-like [Scleropages formosus]